jgi:hypothetical protein
MRFDLFGAIVATNDDAGVFDFDGPPTVFDFPVADRTFFDFHGLSFQWLFSLRAHSAP